MSRKLSMEQANALAAVAVVAHKLLPEFFCQTKGLKTDSIVDKTIKATGRLLGNIVLEMAIELCPDYSEEEEDNAESIRWLTGEFRKLISECKERAEAEIKESEAMDKVEAEA